MKTKTDEKIIEEHYTHECGDPSACHFLRGYCECSEKVEEELNKKVEELTEDIKKPKRFPYKSSSSLYFRGMDDMKNFILELVEKHFSSEKQEEKQK